MKKHTIPSSEETYTQRHLRTQENTMVDQLAGQKRQAGGTEEALALTANQSHLPIRIAHTLRYPFTLPRPLTATLRTLSRQQGVNLFVTLAAALNTVLYRYTGQGDLLLCILPAGYTGDGQPSDASQHAMVLHTSLAHDPTFRELLIHMGGGLLQTAEQQEISFERPLKTPRPYDTFEQDARLSIMFALQPAQSLLLSSWALQSGNVPLDRSLFDISLLLETGVDEINGYFAYSDDLFDEPTIARIAGHLLVLLAAVASDPEQRLSQVPLLTNAERHQILVQWNATQATYLADQSLHQLFEMQVKRTPDKIALVFDRQELTYRELNTRANQLAGYLQALGVGPEALVGVCMERSPEMVVGLLGILKAGGAYVPLDPTYPQERLAFMLEDSQVNVLLTQQRLVDRLLRHAARIICLDSDWPTIACASTDNPESPVTAENLAYVIYTSGSTGRPKGVAIAHRSAVAFAHWAKSVFTSEDFAGVLASTSICFDLSVFEIFVPLSCGGTVLLVENALHLPRLTTDRPVTLLNTVPSVATELVRTHGIPTSVRTVNLAGEPLPGTLVQQLYHQEHIQRVFNLYGPSEDTTYSTYALMEREEHNPSIGRPISNTQVYILDTHLQPVPIGVAGELYLGGDGLAREYLHRPELTAERFIHNPFSRTPGARLYKTGDLARYRSDGTIMFLGRIDHQVKIRGFRVELGEIEATLRRHPALQDVVVTAREDTPGEKRLVAYVVPHTGKSVTTRELQSHIEHMLPSYMMPSAFVQLATLPLTPNGKINRRALPTPVQTRQSGEEPFVAPLNATHYQLLHLWEELLEVRPIGIRDNFFHLGGHSLLAARLVEQIEQIFGRKLPFATLFAGPTIEQLALALESEEEAHPLDTQETESSARTSVVAVQTGGSRRPFFYLHGAWNNGAFYCFRLAQHMGPDQPFYALAPYNFEGVQTMPTVEQMATSHIQAIRAIQPEGPYLLGGFCNGGLVAYEMSRQLQAQGQSIELLVLIEPASPPISHVLVHDLIGHIVKPLHLNQDQQMNAFLRLRHIYKYLRHERKQEDLKAFRRIDASILTLTPTIPALRQDDHALLDWIVMGYPYRPYDGKIMLLWPTEEPFYGVWRRKATQEHNITLLPIPGTHIGCRTTHIDTLAETLKQCIEDVQPLTEREESYKDECITV